MRKALIAIVVAAGLFAVGALAAEFTLNAEDSASGSDAVEACTDRVDVTFDEQFDATLKDWYIASITVDLGPNTCTGADATLVLQDEDDDGAAIVLQDTKTDIGAGTSLNYVPVCSSPTTTCDGDTNGETAGGEVLLVSQVGNAAFLINDLGIPTA